MFWLLDCFQIMHREVTVVLMWVVSTFFCAKSGIGTLRGKRVSHTVNVSRAVFIPAATVSQCQSSVAAAAADVRTRVQKTKLFVETSVLFKWWVSLCWSVSEKLTSVILLKEFTILGSSQDESWYFCKIQNFCNPVCVGITLQMVMGFVEDSFSGTKKKYHKAATE